MSVQTDPLQSIVEALRTQFLGMADLGLVDVRFGWPESQIVSIDGNLPALFVWPLSDQGDSRSDGSVHAVVKALDELTATVYRERLRKIYRLQLIVVAKTLAETHRIAWSVEQQLVLNPRLQLGVPDVETAVLRYKGQEYPTDPTGYYQRTLLFDVTARLLSESTEPLLKQITTNEGV